MALTTPPGLTPQAKPIDTAADSRTWMAAVLAAVTGGADSATAIQTADSVMLAHKARFSSSLDDRFLGATFNLSTALQYYERSALTGKSVMLVGTMDSPPMGKIKDFRDGATPAVLVLWESGNVFKEDATWVQSVHLQVVMPLG